MSQQTAASYTVGLLIFLFLVQPLPAQERPPVTRPQPFVAAPVCGADGWLSGVRQDASFRAREEQVNRQVLEATRQLDDAILTLPVVFHVISKNPSAVPDARLLDALKELNDAYANAGSFAAPLGIDTKIRFCLAQKDPEGGVTTGINRVESFFATKLSPIIEDRRLKNLVQWDPARYINIWYVESMEEEWTAMFNCDTWLRDRYDGYATMPPGGHPQDGIVVAGFGYLLIHEMAHYLGLYHTYEGFSCLNNNCETDGDRVCDTPPDRFMGASPCSSPSNSCSSDTLSGFANDVPDLSDNYMGGTGPGCSLRFTEGQAKRMRAVVSSQRSGLLHAVCEKPCTDAVTAFIRRSNPYPLPGDVLTFTASSSGASRYEWLLNGAVVSTDASFTRSFATTGKYKVTLKAYSADACYASYTDNVIVTCGVTARFYTNQRTLASKDPILLDSVLFTNTSVNATSFKWLMRSDKGMAEQVVSTGRNLEYVFRVPANYVVRLIATNGSCTDTTEPYPVTVHDPTPEATLNIWNVTCYQQTKVQLSFWVCNSGFKALPAGVPITFYDADPRTASARKLGPTFFTPAAVPGNCCSYTFTHIVDAGREGLNQLYAVVNDSGTTIPLRLPNTPVPERDYSNNIVSRTNFAFRVEATPPVSTLEPGDTLQLSASAGPGAIASYRWQPAYNLSCPTCPVTNLIADTTSAKQVIVTTQLGCYDTATVKVSVPPANDYTVTIDKAACAANNQLHIGFTVRNSFKRGAIPRGLTVSFYKGDPATGSAVLLPPVYTVANSMAQKAASFTTLIQGLDSGRIYAVVNDKGGSVPVALPNTGLLEKAYGNNAVYFDYRPETLLLLPADTTVFRKETVPLSVATPLANPGSVTWQAGPGYSLTCTNCPSSVATVTDASVVFMQALNAHGCVIRGEATVKIFPPDMTVTILERECFTNNSIRVRFRVCMNNNYDSVWAGIPVSFYEGSGANAKPLLPVFYTPARLQGGCSTFTHHIAAPAGTNFFAVVNDKGGNGGRAYEETDYTNNRADTVYEPFTVRILPGDTSIPRLESVELVSHASGGTATSYAWSPARYTSCTSCPATIARPPYTMKYGVVATNEHACTDTAWALVKTFTGGLIQMPNAFTPNRDGSNDVFYVLAGADARMVKDFSIFNRWGEQVFRVREVLPNDPAHGWDGRYKGRDAMGGVYVYYVSLEDSGGHTEIYKGTVVLIR